MSRPSSPKATRIQQKVDHFNEKWPRRQVTMLHSSQDAPEVSVRLLRACWVPSCPSTSLGRPVSFSTWCLIITVKRWGDGCSQTHHLIVRQTDWPIVIHNKLNKLIHLCKSCDVRDKLQGEWTMCFGRRFCRHRGISSMLNKYW